MATLSNLLDKMIEATNENTVGVGQLSEEIDNYLPKNQGSANVGKILVVGTDGNLTLAEMPEGSSGDVIGTLDESNNILLTGNLANGTYTLKYENTDGTYTEIGNLTVGKAGITNLADPTSADWIINGRAGSDGTNRTDAPGHRLTNFIPVSNGAIVRVKNFDITNTYASAVYDANKATINSDAVGNLANEDCITELNLSGEIERFTIDNENIAFVRLCGVPTGADEDIIITVNEEII